MKEPKLRFKEENGMQFPDWEKSKFSDVFDNINNSTFSRDCLNYVDGNVKYIHYGDILTTFDSMVNVEASDVPYVNKDIDCQKYQLLADGDIIVADTAEDDTVGKAVEIVSASNVKVISGLHTIACRPKLKFTSGYLGYYMNSNSYHNQLRPYMQGVKVTSISKANIALTNVSIPSLPEQQKIALLFSEIDTLIQSAEKELEGYRELKQGMLQRMFPKQGELVPEIRFPEFTDDWEEHELFEMFNYEQPSKYIVKNDDYEGCSKYPVLTANKGFILGYTDETEGIYDKGEVIIFDDFTCDHKFVNFPFKVKSSAIKFLTPKNNYNLSFLSELLSVMNQQPLSHQRHWISVMQPSIALIPSLEEQKKIGEYFSNLDNLIALQQKELDGYKELKKGLLQQMFC